LLNRLKNQFDDVKRSLQEGGDELVSRTRAGMDAMSTQASGMLDSVTQLKDQAVAWAAQAMTPSSLPEPELLAPADLDRLARQAAPVVWLLGKTGVGKSSVIAALTGASHAEVGNGFEPCTRSAQFYDFPADTPLIRFLDTRGLSEPGYEPAADIAWCQAQAHLVIVVMKAADPSQDEVLAALRTIRQIHPEWPVLVVQTGLHDLYGNPADHHPAEYVFDNDGRPNQLELVPRRLANALAFQRDLFKGLKGTAPRFVPVDFTQASDGFEQMEYGRQALIDAILEVAPTSVQRLIRLQLQQEKSGQPALLDQDLHMQILYWSAGSAAVGAAPVVGLVTVPAAQAAMLAQLARRYGLSWEFKDLSALAGMLGLAMVANQGALLAFRQLAKLGPWVIPLAAAQDYAVTYALGRAACVYLGAQRDLSDATARQVRAAFAAGLRQAFSANKAAP
jgi:uncharacterized protein (DUF697 family)